MIKREYLFTVALISLWFSTAAENVFYSYRIDDTPRNIDSTLFSTEWEVLKEQKQEAGLFLDSSDRLDSILYCLFDLDSITPLEDKESVIELEVYSLYDSSAIYFLCEIYDQYGGASRLPDIVMCRSKTLAVMLGLSQQKQFHPAASNQMLDSIVGFNIPFRLDEEDYDLAYGYFTELAGIDEECKQETDTLPFFPGICYNYFSNCCGTITTPCWLDSLIGLTDAGSIYPYNYRKVVVRVPFATFFSEIPDSGMRFPFQFGYHGWKAGTDYFSALRIMGRDPFTASQTDSSAWYTIEFTGPLPWQTDVRQAPPTKGAQFQPATQTPGVYYDLFGRRVPKSVRNRVIVTKGMQRIYFQ